MWMKILFNHVVFLRITLCMYVRIYVCMYLILRESEVDFPKILQNILLEPFHLVTICSLSVASMFSQSYNYFR